MFEKLNGVFLTSQVTSYVISLGTGSSTSPPPTRQAQVVGALPTDVVVAQMVVEGLRICKGPGAVDPETWMGIVRAVGWF